MHRFNIRRPLLAALALALLVPAFAFAATPTVNVPDEKIVAALTRVSWSAIIAGAVVALAIHSALSILGLGIGLSAVDPHNHKHPIKGVPTMMLVWMFVAGLVSLFAGGYLAARMSNSVVYDSILHGVITWSLATVVLACLAGTSAGYLIGGTFRLLGAGVSAVGSVAGGAVSAAGQVAGGAASAAGSLAGGAASLAGGTAAAASNMPQDMLQKAKDALGDVVPQLDWRGIKREAKQLLHLGENDGQKQGDQQKQGNQQGDQQKQGNQQDKQGAAKLWEDKEEVGEVLSRAYGAIREGGLSNVDRDELMTMISERAGVSKEEANKTIEKWEKQYREAKQQYDVAVARAEQKARDAAAATTAALSRVALWTFASLLLGVAVAGLGGYMGSIYFLL